MDKRSENNISNGMNRLFKHKKGVTMVETILAALLISLIFMAVSSLYIASQKFYIGSSQKVIIGYELQYAIQHIYKNTMRAMGDETAPPGTSAVYVVNSETVDIRIPNNDPVSMSNYSDVSTYSYYKSGDTLMFDNGSGQESLVPKVVVSAVNFAKSGNALTGYITASYGAQSATFYFTCHPRQASFN